MFTEEIIKAMPTRKDELGVLAADAWKTISTICALSRMPIEAYRKLETAVSKLSSISIAQSKLET